VIFVSPLESAFVMGRLRCCRFFSGFVSSVESFNISDTPACSAFFGLRPT